MLVAAGQGTMGAQEVLAVLVVAVMVAIKQLHKTHPLAQ
jgi:hypothetical protein